MTAKPFKISNVQEVRNEQSSFDASNYPLEESLGHGVCKGLAEELNLGLRLRLDCETITSLDVGPGESFDGQ